MPLPQIREIRIKGYKSLADETNLEIRPLTIIAGANSSGKSSVMQPLLLLKQTLASPSDSESLQIAGPNVAFTNYKQMLYQCAGNKKPAKKISIGFTLEWETHFHKGRQQRLDREVFWKVVMTKKIPQKLISHQETLVIQRY